MQMNEYNYTVDKWYYYGVKDHGKLPANHFHAVPYIITNWYDNREEYLAKCALENVEPND